MPMLKGFLDPLTKNVRISWNIQWWDVRYLVLLLQTNLQVPPFTAGRPVDSHSFGSFLAYWLHYDTMAWSVTYHATPQCQWTTVSNMSIYHICAFTRTWKCHIRYKYVSNPFPDGQHSEIVAELRQCTSHPCLNEDGVCYELRGACWDKGKAKWDTHLWNQQQGRLWKSGNMCII